MVIACTKGATVTKLIIFDFWGTLIENGVRPSPSKQVRYFLRVKEPFSEFVVKFEEAFMTKKFDNLNQGFEAVVEAFDKRIPDFVYDKLVGMWNKFSILSHPYDETVAALEDLKKDYKLVVLSNTDNFSLRQVLDKFDLEKHFDKIYLSCETGKLKSNPDSYKQILDDFEAKPEECLMVGDSPQSDLASAEAAGVPAVLIDRRDWSDIEEKISDLQELRSFIEKK
ncbi:HAD family hydrolase [Candidatus Woesearchaeota archaeon]|nr:HAD family hydrolase [Candidatus Woesearchaeota archaeon]